MNPHPRIRKAALWGGAMTTVVLSVAWIISGWWIVLWQDRSWSAGIGAGFVVAGNMSGPNADFALGWNTVGLPGFVQGGWSFQFDTTPMSRGVAVPLWFPVSVALAVTCVAGKLTLIARRRDRIGSCPKCNYNRAGLAVTAVCPECGAAPSGPLNH